MGISLSLRRARSRFVGVCASQRSNVHHACTASLVTQKFTHPSDGGLGAFLDSTICATFFCVLLLVGSLTWRWLLSPRRVGRLVGTSRPTQKSFSWQAMNKNHHDTFQGCMGGPSYSLRDNKIPIEDRIDLLSSPAQSRLTIDSRAYPELNSCLARHVPRTPFQR